MTETTVINARKNIFPEVHLTGCHYHFPHAVHKKAHLVKLDATPEGREIIKLCANLPLLPGGEINYCCWLDIVDIAPNTENMLIFKHYMERQWIRLGASLISYAQDRHRTNLVEEWHRRLNVPMPHKPTLTRFLYKT